MASMQKMMKDMQKMQRQMNQMQEELHQTPFTGKASGGVVEATVNGAGDLLSIRLDPEVVDPEDIEMLQDLIVTAVNDAIATANRESEARMAELTKGLKMPGIPGLF